MSVQSFARLLVRPAVRPAALRLAWRHHSCGAHDHSNCSHDHAVSWDLPLATKQHFNEREVKAMKTRFQSLLTTPENAITPSDVQQLLMKKGNFVDLNTAQEYLDNADKDRDGKITWQEFAQMTAELKAGKLTPHLAAVFFPMQEDENLDILFRNNREWVARQKAQDPEYFAKLKKGQQPQYLFIGCADSRVPAQELMGMKAGEMFVHRNIANLVVNSDLNSLSVIAYAVEVLGVQDVIVCGHYECGGVRAAATAKDHGLVEHWIRNIRDVIRLHEKELSTISDPDQYHRRMVELNVTEQCLNLAANPTIQAKQAKNGLPRIHGFVYDVAEGLLQRLSFDVGSHVKGLQHIYDTGAGILKRDPWASRLARCENELSL